MKITGITALFAAALAPTVAGKKAIVQLSNDRTGAWADIEIRENGRPHSVNRLWRDTAVAKSGNVHATSAQFDKFQENTVCTITQDRPAVDVELDATQTWVSLHGGKVVNLERAHVSCRNV